MASLRNAVASSSRAGASPSSSSRPLDALIVHLLNSCARTCSLHPLAAVDTASPYMVVGGLPRTALPRDMYTALKQADALGGSVGREVTLADSEPFGLLDVSRSAADPSPTPFAVYKRPHDPRAQSHALDSSFHITYPSRQASARAMSALSTKPPFFALQQRGPGERTAPEASRRGLRVSTTAQSGPLWYRAHLESMLAEANAGAGAGAGAGRGAGEEWKGEVRRLVDERRIAPVNEALRGRQVLLQGMPAGLEYGWLRQVIADYQVSDLDGVIKLPGCV